jgi:hypothetical protein
MDASRRGKPGICPCPPGIFEKSELRRFKKKIGKYFKYEYKKLKSSKKCYSSLLNTIAFTAKSALT